MTKTSQASQARFSFLGLGMAITVAVSGCHSHLRVGRTTVDASTAVDSESATGMVDATGGGPPDAGPAAQPDSSQPDSSYTISDVMLVPDTRADVGKDSPTGPRLELVAGPVGGYGNLDGIGTQARFNGPYGIASDGAGHLFVADTLNRIVRKIDVATQEVTTLAGSGASGNADGIGSAAQFMSLFGLTTDGQGNLFVSDQLQNAIRKIVIATGEVTTLAGRDSSSIYADGSYKDGIGNAARFYNPMGVVSDGAGNLFVSDFTNQTIRKIVIATREVTTFAGSPEHTGQPIDGIGTAAGFRGPVGITTDGLGNLFVGDAGSCTIRKIVIATREVTTLAGSPSSCSSVDGIGSSARFNNGNNLVSDRAGNLFLTDANRTVRKIVVATGEVTTLAGSPGIRGRADGIGNAAQFDAPSGLASDGIGNLFVVDNYVIRKVVIATAEVTSIAGVPSEPNSSVDGVGTAARFDSPYGIVTDGEDNLFVTDHTGNTIRKIAIATGATTTLAGTRRSGSSDGLLADAQFFNPLGLALDGAGDLFVTEWTNQTVRKIALASEEVTTVAGSPLLNGSTDGDGTDARFYNPWGIAIDGAGHLFVADRTNHTIRQIVIASGTVSTLAGAPSKFGNADGTGSAARFNYPNGISTDGTGNLFVADAGNNAIRKVVIATGEVTTLAGGVLGHADGIGSEAQFAGPAAVVSDGAGSLFVADTNNSTVRKIEIATRTVTTVVGTPGRQGVLPGPLPATLHCPRGLAFRKGELFITDSCENKVLVARF